jgi:hypothetical protein
MGHFDNDVCANEPIAKHESFTDAIIIKLQLVQRITAAINS